MSNQINIFNMHVNGITQNANINVGKTLQNSHTSNIKLFGANFSIGDFSPSCSLIFSSTQDSDTSDQGQTENPTSPNSNQ